MMRRCVVLVLVSLLACSLFCRAFCAEPVEVSGAPMLHIDGLALTPWEPAASFEGGAQFDRRLDKPVQFWRAGAPLQEVFADFTRQTGVALNFWPAQRDDPRVPVTLYLNRQNPPSLREVMAQLSWVTGCGFASSGDAAARAYHLLATSVGRGAAEQMVAQQQAQQEQFRSDRQDRQQSQRQAAAAQFDESKAALALTPEQAIARYRGKNDALLLNLLDPSRRAALTLLAGLPQDDANQLLTGSDALARPLSAWSQDQQAAIKQALGPDRDWPADATITVSADPRRGAALTAAVPGQGRRRPLARVSGLLSSGDLGGRDQIALLRLLGEVKTPEQEAAVRDQQQATRDAARTAFQQQFAQRREQAFSATRTLSPERTTLLSSLPLADLDSAAGLWKLQEAVAKATGLHVISDCFWPPRFGGPRQRDATAIGNALEALSAACTAGPGGFGPGFGQGGMGDLSTQWGDAGSFLRFRSRSADLWRGAMLPAGVLTQLDAWLEPAVSEAAAVDARNSPLSGDLEKLGWLAGHLNDLQARLGGAIPYEDPSDPKGARRQELRRAALSQLAPRLPLLRLLASFTPEQWKGLRGDGLRWGYDLTPEQQASDALRGVSGNVPADRLKDVVIRIGETEVRNFGGRGNAQNTTASVPAITFSLDGTVTNQVPMAGGFWGGGPGGRGRPGGPPGG